MTEKETEARQSRSKTLIVMMGLQLMIVALVFHLWMDMMGSVESGGKIAGVIVVFALLLLLAPNLINIYEEYIKNEG